MGTISCKGSYKSGSDKSRKLFPYITMIAINGRVRLPSCRPDFALLVLLDSTHACRMLVLTHNTKLFKADLLLGTNAADDGREK